jgi:hypothetical protein
VRAALALLCPLALACARAASGADAESAPTIVRITLPLEADERRPVAVPTEPENTVELDFPWPVEDWAGRGFTPDPEKFAGDFVIEAARGSPRLFVTPVASGAHRVLHVVVAEPGAPARGVPIEFIPAPSGLAWNKVLFESGRAAGAPRPRVSLEARPPGTRLREATAESEIGLLRTLRLMLNTTEDGAGDIAAANPALTLKGLDGTPRSFGDFTISSRFAIRDAATGALGICASVANQTARRLVFEPAGWAVRVGDRVYPVPTVDFPDELEPGATGAVLLVLARGPDGAPTPLLADNSFEISAVLGASVNPRPVIRMPLKGLGPE